MEKPKNRKLKRAQIRRMRFVLLTMTALVILFAGAVWLYLRANTSEAVAAVMNASPTPTYLVQPTTTPEDVCALSNSEYRLVKDNRRLDDYSYESPSGKFVIRESGDGTYIGLKGEPEQHRILPRGLLEEITQARIFVFSPDEHFATYLYDHQLMLLRLDGYHSEPLFPAETMPRYPLWSPDSRRFVYEIEGELRLIEIETRLIRPLMELTDSIGYVGWSPDSRIFVVRNRTTLYLLPVLADAPVQERVVSPVSSPMFSPDSQYVAYIVEEAGSAFLHLLSLYSGQPLIFDINDLNPSMNLIWSPDSQHVLLRATTKADGNLWHGVFGVDERVIPWVKIRAALANTGQANTASLREPKDWWQYQPVWGKQGSALFLNEQNFQGDVDLVRLWSLDIDSSPIQAALSYEYVGEGYDKSQYYQREDGFFVATYNDGANSRLEAVRDSGSARQTFRFADVLPLTPDTLISTPVFSPDSRVVTLLITSRVDPVRSMLIMDLDTGKQYVLSAGNGDMGQVLWSPDQRKVGVTAASTTAQGDRTVTFAWVDLRTGAAHQTSTGYSVFDVVWSPDNRYLAYGIWDAQGTHIEIVDTELMQTVRALADVQAVNRLAWDNATGLFTVWWQAKNEDIVYHQGFTPDGTSAFTLKAANRLKSMRYTSPIVGLSGVYYDDPLTTLQTTQVIWSPDRTQALIKTGVYRQVRESLQLVKPDGSDPVLITENRDGLGNPLWSPDGKLFAYSESFEISGGRMHVMANDGRELTVFPAWIPLAPSARYDKQWIWQACK